MIMDLIDGSGAVNYVSDPLRRCGNPVGQCEILGGARHGLMEYASLALFLFFC